MNAEEMIGEKLRRERERRSLTLEDVHHRLHIHTDILERMERSKFQSWPGGIIYAKAFLRQYCNFLGLNTAEILSEFEMLDLPQDQVKLTLDEKAQEADRRKRFSEWWNFMTRHGKAITIAAGIIVGFLLLIAFVGSITSKSEKPSSPPKTQEARREATPEVRRNVVRQETPAQKPRSAPRQESRAPESTMSSDFLNSPDQKNFPTIKPDDPMMLEVRATTDVWMRVVSDGKLLFESILKQGEKEHWVSDRFLELKFGRPEGVELGINGYSLGKPGKGKVKEVRITREGMKSL